MVTTEVKKVERIGFFKKLFVRRDSAQRRAIKILKKELASAKIDLYNIKNDNISAAVARIIYDIYRLSYPLRQSFSLDQSKKRFTPSFESAFVLSFHSEDAIEIQNKFSQDYIKKLTIKYGIEKTYTYIEKLWNDYLDLFDKEKIAQINSIFTNLLYFARFVHFDFYPLLREFDPKLEEANFSKKPSFSSTEGPLLRDDIYKINRALYRFDVDEKLDLGIEKYSKVQNFEPISKDNLSKLKSLIVNLQRNNYLSLIIRAIDKNISPIPVEKPSLINLFSSYSSKRKEDVYKVLNSLKKKIQDEAISSIVSQLFEGSVIGRIKNYHELNNESFIGLGLPIFEHVKLLNYMKAFLTDKYKPSINKVLNELIISGTFISKSVLNSLSNSYYGLNNSLQIITEFDDDLDIDGDRGRAINRLLGTVKKEKGAKGTLKKIIQDTNIKAKLIIDEQIVNLKDMANSIRIILEDYKKKSHIITSNIKKIRGSNNRQFIEELVQAYKDIYLFLKLLSIYTSIKISRAEFEKNKQIVMEQQN